MYSRVPADEAGPRREWEITVSEADTFEVDPRHGLGGWIGFLADAGLASSDNEADRLRKRVLTLTTMTVVAVVGIWPLTYLFLGLPRAAVVPGTYVIVTALAYVVFARTKNEIAFRNVQLILFLVFPPVLQWVLGGYVGGSAVVMFSALAPVLSLMVVGRPWSTVFLVVFAIVATALGFADLLFRHAAPAVPEGVVVALMVLNIVGVVTIIYFPLAFFIAAFRRAHDALQIERRRSDQLMTRLLPAPVVARLKAGERAIADELSSVAVLFADMVGFTPATEKVPARDIVRRLNLAFTVFDRLADERGLDKIKTIGDSYMVAGGISTDDPGNLLAVADLALAMRDAADSLSIDGATPLQLRFGVDVGAVIGGVVGQDMLSYDIYGDVVNTASRMASHGSPNRIHVTDRVRSRLDGEFAFEAREPISVKGKGMMETFFLERLQ